jgi:hypothetical protein
MMLIRLPDPFEPLRCLHPPGEGAPAAAQPLLLRRREYVLDSELLARGDGYDVERLCAAVRTALRRVVVQRSYLAPGGFDQAWERALWIGGEQTYKLWRGLWHAELLGEAERREAQGAPRPGGALEEQAALRAAKAMLLGDLVCLANGARAVLPGGEWEPFQLDPLLDEAGTLGPWLSAPPMDPSIYLVRVTTSRAPA